MNITSDEKERYQRYLCSREWAVLKEAVHRRCGGICERCNHSPVDHVHHLTYARKYNERLEDLAGWCEGCHEFTHGKRDRDPVMDAPVVIFGVKIQSLYLAGRFDKKNDWRREIAPGWQLGYTTPSRIQIPDGRSIAYAGPNWVDVWGHGYGGLGPHAAADDVNEDHCGSQFRLENPYLCVDERLNEIALSDLMFVWIDSRECFGTLAEIGYWRGQCGSSGFLVIAAQKRDRELWFAFHMANRFILAKSAGEAWKKFWSGEMDRIGEVEDREVGRFYGIEEELEEELEEENWDPFSQTAS